MQASGAGASAAGRVPSPPAEAPSLAISVQRPGFAQAFADMDGAAALPAWLQPADASQPSTRV
ncbi:MAG TPA: hypothetical protein VFS86_11885 [Rhodanobacteraceae bacterium]|jgi:hypothetical protein|nr:hypothetical protein [Rhodanobacteraceae bacterium]